MDDALIISGHKIDNRFFLGTGKFASYKLMQEAIISSGARVVTVALRRVDTQSAHDNILKYIPKECIIMANTSGARNADEAIRIARIARAAGCGDWIKIEVIPDNKYLLPDNAQTILATEVLAKEGFIVMPYVNPDLADARRLSDAGAASIMPLGAPIGTNKGVCMRELIKILIQEISLPIIVDAGIGRPSHAAEAMELGASAVLVNTAVATAEDPVLIAQAFSLAVKAGRIAYRAGVVLPKAQAEPSSPLTGFLR
ncbi:MAG: thiazole synthase [Candidatus Omnitrophica bacterium]|nr:thiazole synthase [Candidatus Omnitrophota bacterium]MBU4303810.1 thiazole synthase [Candidatus Omnitrophota bacterium]MBU4468001.1 thiazole synthase [Candidatus Omnitrophota bacterium]MCG2707798.1 thiazole synthase [Candidatus Omnitrophota bacterium]